MAELTLDDATAILREHVDDGLEAVSVTRGPVGNSQETWFIEAAGPGGTRELVLRRSAVAGVLDWTDRDVESSTLRALSGRGLPVPEVYGSGSLERTYLLMEKRAGAAPFRLSPEDRRSVGRDLGAWLARLHGLRGVDLPAGAPASSREATLAEVRRWWELYDGGRPAPIPLLGALLAWCEQHAPDDGAAPVLLWGDAGPHNVLVADGRVTAMLDWELAHVGHPLDDLGGALWACLGQVDADDVVGGYEDEAGPVDRTTLDYFVALACVTRSIMVVNGVERWLAGTATSPSTAGLGMELLAWSLARGAEAAGWGAVPPPDGQPPELPFRPDAGEAVAGIARWLDTELLPVVEDRRSRRMVRVAAALLADTATRVPPAPADDLAAVEDAAVAAERAGGDPAIRARLLADLGREWGRLANLNRLHGHPLPAGWEHA